MASSWRDRTDRRAALYQGRIAELQAAGDFRGGYDEVLRWVREEMVKRARRTPHQADAVYRAVTKSLTELAESIATYKPKGTEGTRDVAS